MTQGNRVHWDTAFTSSRLVWSQPASQSAGGGLNYIV